MGEPSAGEREGLAPRMGEPLNNARLLSFAAYEDLQAGFARVFRTAGGDWRQFFQRVRELGELPKKQRHAELVSGPPAEPACEV